MHRQAPLVLTKWTSKKEILFFSILWQQKRKWDALTRRLFLFLFGIISLVWFHPLCFVPPWESKTPAALSPPTYTFASFQGRWDCDSSQLCLIMWKNRSNSFPLSGWASAALGLMELNGDLKFFFFFSESSLNKIILLWLKKKQSKNVFISACLLHVEKLAQAN